MKHRVLLVGAAVLSLSGAGVALAADGAAVFKAKCAMCHGENGKADSPSAKAMKAPALAGNAEVAGMADADLVAKIKGIAKHASVKSLPDADMAAAAAHAKALAGAK